MCPGREKKIREAERATSEGAERGGWVLAGPEWEYVYMDPEDHRRGLILLAAVVLFVGGLVMFIFNI